MYLAASDVALSPSSRLLSGLGEESDQEGPADGGGGSSQSEPQWGGGAPEERLGHKQHPARRVHPGRGRPGLVFWLRSGRAGSQWGRVRDVGLYAQAITSALKSAITVTVNSQKKLCSCSFRWQDIVVGAPQYFEKEGEIGGAVYVYINKAGKWNKVKPTRIDGPQNSMFGLAVENLGDINQDGYHGEAVMFLQVHILYHCQLVFLKVTVVILAVRFCCGSSL